MTKWALVATQEMQILNPNPEPGMEPETITVDAGTIVNIIVYNGTAPYTPPSGTELLEVADDKKIGDMAE